MLTQQLVKGLKWGAALVSMLGVAACGTLSVSMEVLDPKVIAQRNDEGLIATGVPLLLASTPDSIEAMTKRLRRVHRQGIGMIRDAYLKEATADSANAAKIIAIADDLLDTFDDRVAKPYQDVTKRLQSYADELKRVMNGRLTVRPGEPGYSEVLAILRAWQADVAQFNSLVRDDVGAFVTSLGLQKALLPTGTAERLMTAVKDIVASQVALIDQALAQLSLQNSPHAYAVASADNERWSKGYNRVYTSGSLGATEVAIKLDPATGNYMLKGLSFDPSDVAAVASKVSTQALLVAAQIAGVPVKLSTAPAANTPGAALAGSSSALMDAQVKIETRRAQSDARRAALLAIANTIVNEQADLKSGSDDERKAAMTAIRNAFLKREAILRPSTAP